MILITGGAGYIGSHVVKLLGEKKYDTIIYDNLSRGHSDLIISGEFIEGDLSDKDLLIKTFKKYDIEAVIHFAAYSLVGESENDPHSYYRNNVANGINLLGAMLDTGVKKIVFSSSAAVYGEPIRVPIEEDHPTVPTNVYGNTKLIFENILRKYHSTYGLDFVSLRYFNAAGADPEGRIGEDHSPETHLIPLVLDAVLGRKNNITIFGTDYDTPDGTCIRDYIHVNDLAEAHILSLRRLKDSSAEAIYNLGNGEGFSVKEVIEAVNRVTGAKVSVVEGNRREGDPARLVASSEKIIKELGWKPMFADLNVIIETAWKWHSKRFGNK